MFAQAKLLEPAGVKGLFNIYIYFDQPHTPVFCAAHFKTKTVIFETPQGQSQKKQFVQRQQFEIDKSFESAPFFNCQDVFFGLQFSQVIGG